MCSPDLGTSSRYAEYRGVRSVVLGASLGTARGVATRTEHNGARLFSDK